MWIYEKRLQYPVNIKKTCPKTASLIISQFGGPDGELAASMRYLSQRYTMPCREAAGLLTDIGTEELAHLEIICAMVFQLTKDLTAEPVSYTHLILITYLPPENRGLQTEQVLCLKESKGGAKQKATLL